MIQALAAFLPEILAAAGLSGGAAAGTGAAAAGATGAAAGATAGAAGASAATGGGFTAFLGRMLGGASAAPFATEAELGAGMRQAGQVADLIGAVQAAHGESQQRSTADQAKYREDEARYLYGDPGTDARLAEEARKRAAYEAEIVGHRQKQSEINSRIQATLHPEDAKFDAMGLAGGMAGSFVGFGGLSALFGGGGSDEARPGLAAQLVKARDDAAFAGPAGWLARKMPGVQFGSNMQQAALQPMTDLGVGQAEGHVLGQGAGFASSVVQKAMSPTAIIKGELATEVSRLPGLLRDWGTELVDSRRHLAEYNGTLAIAFADANRRELMRSIESGARTGGATAGLSDALQDLADEIQPIKDAVTIVISSGVEVGLRVLTLILMQLQSSVGLLRAIAGPVSPVAAADKIIAALGNRGGDTAMPLVDFIRDVGKRDLRRGVPRR